MKHFSVLFLIIILLIQNHGKFLQAEAKEGFIRTKGVQFMLDGSPYYANGFNAYWLMYFASDPSQRNKVTTAFQQAASYGLTVARTWAFSDGGYNALQYSPGSYNEKMFQGLDFVVSEAGKYGIKLILSLVDSYPDLGGRKQYVQWASGQGQQISSDDDFYTNSLVKQFYRNHIRTVITRKNTITGVAYKDDATIMSWELMNEPRCPSDPSGRTIQSWIEEMAPYLKSIDSDHLLEVGLEGFYGESSARKQQYNPSFQVGTDFIANNQVHGIDFATVHTYPDQWVNNPTEDSELSFLSQWVDVHIQDAQEVLHKPVLFAEFGKSTKDQGYSVNQRDQMFSQMYSAVYSSASGGGAAGGAMFWHLLTDGMDNYRDGYEIIFDQSPSTSGLITQQSQKLNKIRRMYVRLRDVEKWNKARQSTGGKN